MYADLSSLTESQCFAYLDGIICFSLFDVDEYIGRLKRIFDRVRAANLTLNPDKCKFIVAETNYLGLVLSSEDVRSDPAKITAVKKYPVPTSAVSLPVRNSEPEPLEPLATLSAIEPELRFRLRSHGHAPEVP
ncbi:hypothetical protein CBL_20382 [Carabus blaptoides fortunei]